MVIAICGFMPQSFDVLPTERCADAVHELICSVPATEPIRDDDPALVIFWQRKDGERIEDAKVDLSDERWNGCDQPESQHDT